jgi:predicted MFS family arabinose efflux permease
VAGSLLLFAIVRTLHGAPFGSVTVANSTVAIDVLHPERRAEGIGYYGLSNNVATAISPSVALWIYNETGDFNVLFLISMLVAAVGMVIDATVKMPKRELIRDKAPLSFDRFFLLDGWRQALSMMCFSLSYGVVSTYVAIYGRQKLGIEGGSGFFFLLLAIGLIISRLTGGRKLRQGLVTRNAAVGMSISLCGYFLFALVPNEIGYYGAALIVGLGNGHMYPAYQTMFINLAPNSRRGTANSSLLVSWDVGIGLGTLIGGVVAQYVSYMAAFLVAAFVNLVGVLIFFILIKNHYNAHKLR